MELNGFDKTIVAATFAETGEHETASQSSKSSGGKLPVEAPPKKPFGKMIFFGAISLTGYVILLTNQQAITDLYTMGGWHTAFPVGTALVFSFIHGAFASNLLSVLGIEAKGHH